MVQGKGNDNDWMTEYMDVVCVKKMPSIQIVFLFMTNVISIKKILFVQKKFQFKSHPPMPWHNIQQESHK